MSTPRIEKEASDQFFKPPKPPQVADDKKSCFGFDVDDDGDDCDVSDASQASIGGGCVTLSEISPVKRSSMLPPSHFISMVASPSTSTLSVTNEFAKPLSARFASLFRIPLFWFHAFDPSPEVSDRRPQVSGGLRRLEKSCCILKTNYKNKKTAARNNHRPNEV